MLNLIIGWLLGAASYHAGKSVYKKYKQVKVEEPDAWRELRGIIFQGGKEPPNPPKRPLSVLYPPDPGLPEKKGRPPEPEGIPREG